MDRVLVPELLDHLPADDPEAQHSRRDLRRLNSLMGNAAILAHAVQHLTRPPRTLIEIGAGDGTLLLSFLRRMGKTWPGGRITLLDLQDLVEPETRKGFADLGWSCEVRLGDAAESLRDPGLGRADLLIANLFLHHFEPPDLAALLRAASGRTEAFLAVEPRRSGIALAGALSVGLIGCNRVTRHDARVSVRAGFAGRELSSLWPSAPGWQVEERAARLFSHVFLAHQDTDR